MSSRRSKVKRHSKFDPRDPLGAQQEESEVRAIYGPRKHKHNRRITAPHIDPAALPDVDFYAAQLEESAEARRQRKTDQMLLRNLLRMFDNHPTRILGYLMSKNAWNTARNTAARWMKYNPAMRASRDWNVAYDNFTKRCAEYEAGGARPATPEQMRRLIGDLSEPEEKVCYQMWVGAARHRETLPKLNDQGAALRGRVWTQKLWDPENVISLTLRTHKGATRGQRPYAKWVNVAHGHLKKGVWKRQKTSYRRILAFIKKRLGPEYTTYSARKGAIQLLEEYFDPRSVARLTGHTTVGQIPSLVRSYTARRPSHQEARDTLGLTDLLQEAVLHPRRFRRTRRTSTQQRPASSGKKNSIKKHSKRERASRRL